MACASDEFAAVFHCFWEVLKCCLRFFRGQTGFWRPYLCIEQNKCTMEETTNPAVELTEVAPAPTEEVAAEPSRPAFLAHISESFWD